MSKNFTDYDIQAFLDDELDEEDRELVQEHIESNPDALKRYYELKIQKKAICLWWENNRNNH